MIVLDSVQEECKTLPNIEVGAAGGNGTRSFSTVETVRSDGSCIHETSEPNITGRWWKNWRGGSWAQQMTNPVKFGALNT